VAFSEEDPEVYFKFRSSVGAAVLPFNPLPPPGITELICPGPKEVVLFLALVHSLVALDEDFSRLAKPFHKPLPDFVANPSRWDEYATLSK
jgi:hypothetical protein